MAGVGHVSCSVKGQAVRKLVFRGPGVRRSGKQSTNAGNRTDALVFKATDADAADTPQDKNIHSERCKNLKSRTAATRKQISENLTHGHSQTAERPAPTDFCANRNGQTVNYTIPDSLYFIKLLRMSASVSGCVQNIAIVFTIHLLSSFTDSPRVTSRKC